LLQANSLFHLTFTASQLIGLVVLGPLLAKIVGVDGLFVSMAAAIVLCGALVWPLPSSRGEHDPSLPTSEEEAIRGVWHDVRDIWHFVTRDRVVALAMVQWTIGAILGLVVATLVPGFAKRLLYVQPEDAVFIMVPAQTCLQERAPVELRGRVFAVQLMLSNFASIVPLLLLGGLADLIGVDTTLMLIGILIAIAGAISVRIAPGVAPWAERRRHLVNP